MHENFKICDLDDLRRVTLKVDEIVSSTGRNIIILDGDLGTGKTTFVRDYVKFKESDDQADSPTFSLINDYAIKDGFIHHFDLYRLESLDEIEDIGFWEYIDSGNICLIEWPDKITELLPVEKVVNISIVVNLEQCREFTVSY